MNMSINDYVDVDWCNRPGRPYHECRSGSARIVALEPEVQVIFQDGPGSKKPVTIIPRSRVHLATRNSLPARVHIDGVAVPSLLDPEYAAAVETLRQLRTERTQTTTNTTATNRNNNNTITINNRYSNITTSELLFMAMDGNGIHTIVTVLQYCRRNPNNNFPRGFLRRNEALSANRLQPKPRSYLSDEERGLVIQVASLARMAKADGVDSLLSYAWDISVPTIRNFIYKVKENGNLQYKRKVRNDAGTNILMNETKRQQSVTAYKMFSQTYRRRFIDDTIKAAEIKEVWDELDEIGRQPYADMAEQYKQRLTTALVDVSRIMNHCRGQVTWQQLTSLLSGDVGPKLLCHETLRNIIMNLPGSRYRTTKIHPQLKPANVQQRKQWAICFAVFWESAKIVFENVQVLLLHMDEKWFYSIIVRKTVKQIPLLGIEPAHHYIRNKQNLPKVMGICTCGVLPHDNNLQKGGRAVKISLDRVGGMFPAQRDAYRRQLIGGRIRYPAIPANQTRVRGQLYWKPLDITGSKENVRGVPKFSLRKYFREVWFPRVEQKVRELENETQQRIVVRLQWDNAGPHKDKALTNYLTEEFKRLQWHMVPQPSNSPVTNVLDACVFPALSKIVTREQAVNNNSYEMKGEQIWRTATSAWEKLEETAIARSFVCHSQVAAAIAKHNGGDEFVREKNAMHWGVRKHYLPLYANNGNNNRNAADAKPIGVTVAVQLGNPLSDLPPLRYDLPNVDENYANAEALIGSGLKPSELSMIYNSFPVEHHLSNVIEEAWQMVKDDYEGEQENESEAEQEDQNFVENNQQQDDNDQYEYNKAEAEADEREYEFGPAAADRNNNCDDDDDETTFDEEEYHDVEFSRMVKNIAADSDEDE